MGEHRSFKKILALNLGLAVLFTTEKFNY
uniref:Uncharacterized protein n=1 Tax=Rhizophora mucronata TaxID=61149 RepID=A0A2P2PRT8_RHIMU